MTVLTAPKLAEIEEARKRLEGVARVTPVYSSETLSKLIGRDVWLKAENLQRTGSFKIRAPSTRSRRSPTGERRAGVVAASAGNHGQAVAWAAREVGAKATIFMPQDAPMAKVEPTKSYGAEARLVGVRFEDALEESLAYAEKSGATFVHPYEDEQVIAGQGTIGLELAGQVPAAGTVVIPVGGGGLSSGISLALRAVKPDLRIVGVQAGLGGWTIADGIAVKSVGEETGRILDGTLDEIVCQRRRDLPGDRAPAGAREARRGGRRRGRRGGAARQQGWRRRPGRRAALGRQHRPDRADLRDAPRAHVGGSLPRPAHASRATGPAS